MVTRNDLVNRASLRLGLGDAQTELPENAARYACYDGVVDDLLSRHLWRHNRRTRQLTRLNKVPDHYWKFAFQLPGDMLGDPRAAFDAASCNRPFTGWELVYDESGPARVLVTDEVAVWLRYCIRSPESIWPGYFQNLAVLATMAELALSEREDKGLHDTLYVKCFGTPSEQGAGGLFAQCCVKDGQSSPSPLIAGGVQPLVDVRVNGGRGGWDWRS